MSGVFGIISWDGHPVDESWMNHMMRRLEHRGKDGKGWTIRGRAGLGQLTLAVRNFEKGLNQPVWARDDSFGIVADAFLFNRKELIAQVEIESQKGKDLPDSALILQAYLKWGEGLVDHLDGDFAFVIWDAPAQRLFAARDAFGLRPLFYRCDPGRFIFASEPKAFLGLPEVPVEPDDQMVGEFLLILLISLLQMALILAGGSGMAVPFKILRVVLGLGYILFFPGYCLQAAVYPSRFDLDGKERIALSFGLSLVIIPSLALLLDRLPWHINLWSVSISLLITCLVCLVIAWVRRKQLPARERFTPLTQIRFATWWHTLERNLRITYILLGAVLLIAGFTAFSILATPKPAERMTEFYILGREGKAEYYPFTGVVGEPITVTVGITNREGVDATYQIAIFEDERLTGSSSPLNLRDGQSQEQVLTFTPQKAGDDAEVSLYLYRDRNSEQYRSLRLFLNVKPKLR